MGAENDEGRYRMESSNNTENKEKYVCGICGSAAQKIDDTHIKCLFCGQVTEIEARKARWSDQTVAEQNKEKTADRKKVNPLVVVFLMLCVGMAGGIAAAYMSGNVSAPSRSNPVTSANIGIMKDFYEQVFRKEYKDITDEEFASIKYISYDYETKGKSGQSYHILRYSFTDYMECESDEEFQKTVQVWEINSKDKSWPSDFTKLTGLTCFDSANKSWLSQYKFSKDCKLTCIITSDSLDTVSKTFNPETIKQISADSSVRDFENLGKFPNLENLYMGATGENIDLEAIVNCPNLKSLVMKGKLDASSYEYLEKLEKLEVLNVNDLSLKYCSFLKKGCPNLVELHIGETEGGDISLLANCPNLKRLYFVDNEKGDAKAVGELTELEELSFRMTSEEDILELQKLTKLTRLFLKNGIFGLSDQNLAELANIPNLTDLSVSFGLSGKICGLEAVFNKPGLTSLALKNTFSDQKLVIDAQQLVENKDLITIDFKGWQLIDPQRQEIGFEFLQNYPSLKYLYLVECNVESLDFAAPLFNLKTLDVQENEIADYSPLENCRKLTALYVYGNPSVNPKVSSRVTVYKNRAY